MHKILGIEQNTELWFDFRKYKLGGSKVGGLKPPVRGKFKGLYEGTAGFWKLISERLSLPKDTVEDERERGHRLEPRALELTNKKYDINLVKGTIWQSDTNERLYISPDGEEDIPEPTYAGENKAFDPNKHLMLIWQDIQAQEIEGYRPFNSVPDDCKDQVVHYFTINEKLEKLYWTLECDMTAYEEMEHYCIVIERSTILDEIEKQREVEQSVIQRTDLIVKELKDYFVKK